MKAREFLQKLDEPRVVAAIVAAEQSTSGEIRVFVSHRKLGGDDIRTRAAARFEKLGMMKTREHNAVLLYFLPEEQKFAVIGDTGIHQKCGEDFWTVIAGHLREGLKGGDFTAAVVHAITEVGAALAKHFPPQPDDRDELPNSIARE